MHLLNLRYCIQNQTYFMKNKYTLLVAILLLISQNIRAQSPDLLSYQSVIRDGSNQLVTNQNVGIRISILQGSITGVSVYIETHTITTNANGLVSLQIGGGTVVSGSMSGIDWGNGPYFIKTETDPTGGTTYSITGTSQLLSVPYALHSTTASSLSGGETDPIYSSSVAAGITSVDTASWNSKLDAEVDGSVTNELQYLSMSNDTLYLTNGGFVVMPSSHSQLQTDTLQVGNGTMFSNMQGGKVNIGASGGQAVVIIPVTFPNSFTGVPNVICTASTESGTIFDDSFNITVRQVTATGFVMIVNRVDGTTWGQNLDASWFAFE